MLVWPEEELRSVGHEQADGAHPEDEKSQTTRHRCCLGQIDMAFGKSLHVLPDWLGSESMLLLGGRFKSKS